MKNLSRFLLLITTVLLIHCSSTKSTGGSLPATNGNLKGTWMITDIQVDLPAGFNVTNVFDTAPYDDFKGSTWNLIRNGNGSFELTTGIKQDIYWTVVGNKSAPQFQFKILNGEKARNVDEGYRLSIHSLSGNSFQAVSPVQLAEGKTGSITYTFTKK